VVVFGDLVGVGGDVGSGASRRDPAALHIKTLHFLVSAFKFSVASGAMSSI
jgi:hypothetical protein